MKRIIKTYETCSDELLTKIAEKFPHGIKDRHLSHLTTIKGDKIRVVEIKTDDALYLIKFSSKLEEAIDNLDLEFDLEEDDEMVFADNDDDLDANMVDAGDLADEDLDID